MELMLEFRKHEAEIYRVVGEYGLKRKGVDGVLYLPLGRDKERQRIELELNRKAIYRRNKDNWINRLLRRKPEKILIIHIPELPNNVSTEEPKRSFTEFITGLEIFPPLPEDENKLALSGIYEALNCIDKPSSETEVVATPEALVALNTVE